MQNCRNVYVDVTHECNLNCNFCYDKPQRHKESISLKNFEKACQELTKGNPGRKWIRLLGGEPTIDPRIFDFIKIAKKYRHLVSMSTNGVRIAQDIEFCKQLKKLAPFYIHTTLDGGINNPEIYEHINGRDLGPLKLQALNNLKAVNFRHVEIGALIVGDFKEKVADDLVTIAQQYDNIRGIHLRSGSNVGRFPAENKPLTISDLKELAFSRIKPIGELNEPDICATLSEQNGEICCGGCYQYNGLIHNRTFKVILMEFGSENNSMNCWWRARLSPDKKLLPFFQTMRRRNDELYK